MVPLGGARRIRTADQGFADPCLTTWLWRRVPRCRHALTQTCQMGHVLLCPRSAAQYTMATDAVFCHPILQSCGRVRACDVSIDAPDPVQILTTLGLPAPSRANQITAGWGGPSTWQIERDSILQAVRVFPSAADDAAARERAAMAAALAGGVLAPPVYHSGSCNGFPFILTDWCSGRPGTEAIRARPWAAWSLGMEMGRVQARLHRIIAPGPVRNRPGDWISWAGESESELQHRIRTLPLRQDALLHLDYHPRNIVFEHGRVTGVIDWENVRAGDPRADVARTRAILWLARRSPEVPHLAVPILRMLEAGWLRAYQRDAGPLEHMTIFDAWAFAAMIVDLSPKLGEPGVWLLPSHLDAVHRRLLTLKRRVGIAA